MEQQDLVIIGTAFVAQALKEVGVPSPGVTQGALLYAGVQLVSGEVLAGSVVIAATFAGALVGALGAYAAGTTGAVALLGRFAGIGPGRLEQAIDRLGRRAILSVALGRVVPGLMTPVSVVAGMTRMSVVGFAAGIALSTLAWAAGLASLGALGHSRLAGIPVPGSAPMPVVLAVGTAILLLSGLAWRRRGSAEAARDNIGGVR